MLVKRCKWLRGDVKVTWNCDGRHVIKARVGVWTKSLEDIVEMGVIYTVLKIPTFVLWMSSIAKTFCNALCKLQSARTNGYIGPE
jgi:hypothetical protein